MLVPNVGSWLDLMSTGAWLLACLLPEAQGVPYRRLYEARAPLRRSIKPSKGMVYRAVGALEVIGRYYLLVRRAFLTYEAGM